MDFLSPSTLTLIGAGYALVQSLAFFLSLFVPEKTVVGKAARAVTKWPAQLIPSGTSSTR